MLKNIDTRDIVRLLNQGVSEQSVKTHLLELGATQDEALRMVSEAARRASPPAEGFQFMMPTYRDVTAHKRWWQFWK